jgi:hypothetical protein
MAEPRADQDIATETHRTDAGNWAKPVRTLTSTSVPAGAMDLNVTGRRLAGAGSGFGQLWQKSFWVRLEGTHVKPSEVIRVWKERFGDFWPKGQRMFLPTTGIAPGEVGLINAKPMPGVPSMATGVLVIYADEVSFSFMSPEGHPFAGPLTFSADDEDGVTIVKVDELTRASDPFWELTMMIPFVGGRMQNNIWRNTLRNVAKHFGVDARVEERIVCVDRGRQWSQAKNIWQNAAIRSTFYTFGAPVRKLRPRR